MQWSQKYLPDQQTKDKYKQLENIAKQKGVKIWLGAPLLQSTPSYSGDRKKYQAKVGVTGIVQVPHYSNTTIHFFTTPLYLCLLVCLC